MKENVTATGRSHSCTAVKYRNRSESKVVFETNQDDSVALSTQTIHFPRFPVATVFIQRRSKLNRWKGTLKPRSIRYRHAELCRKDAARALHKYTNLVPEMQTFTHNDGRKVDLLALDGTLPVVIRGVTYQIPVCVWLQENHPYVPPLVFVRPTSTMAIKASQHVDNNGKVYHPFLHEWDYPRSDLAALLQILCSVFAAQSPVYTKSTATPPQPSNYNRPRQPGDSSRDDVCRDVSRDDVGHLAIGQYQHAELCRKDVARALHQYAHFVPEMQTFTHNDGREVDLLALNGTLPVVIRGVAYNIPVCVWLQENHPYVPPLVFVRPTSTMAIKASQHVDTNGKVYHPFLQEWDYPRSDLAALLQILCSVFAARSPVYSKSTATPPQPSYYNRPQQPGYPPQYPL